MMLKIGLKNIQMQKQVKFKNKKKDYDEKVNPIIKKATARRDLSDLSKNVRDRLKDTDDSLSHLSKEDRKKELKMQVMN